jgi:hypothetical protein
MASHSPIRSHHSGDGDKELLKKRAEHEDDVRNSASKKVSVVWFNVTNHFDVGQICQVFVPACGINEPLEITSLTYSAKNKDELQTTLELSPPPKTKAAGKMKGHGLVAATGNVAPDVAATPAAPATWAATGGSGGAK